MKNIFTIILSAFFITKMFCQPGSLDNSFSTDGKTTTLVGTTESEGECVAVQANGKIIMAGTYYNSSHDDYDFAVVRYNTNGTLDNSFAGNGKAGINFSSSADDIANAIAIQSNGMIIVAGSSGYSLESPEYIAVARLKTDGTLDLSFGTNGKVRIPLLGAIKSVAIQSDGRIVLAGDRIANEPPYYDFAVVRLLSSGALDKSFGNNGEVFTDFVGENDDGESVAIQSNGKIVVGGASSSAGVDNFAVARYRSDGTLDSSFGGNGKVRTAIGSEKECYAHAIAIQGNGKILAAGDYINSITDYGEFAVVRYNTNGSLDNSFAGNGKLGIAFGTSDADAYSLAIQSNGKIVVAGLAETSNGSNFAIARVHSSDGTLDNFFGNGGKVTTDFGGYDYGSSVAIDLNGRIVVGGLSITDKRRFAVARYITSGSSLIAMSDDNIGVAKDESTQLKIFPNPAKNYATISFSATGNYIIQLSNVSGKILQTKTGTAVSGINNIRFDVSNYTSGIYIITFIDDKKQKHNLKLNIE